MKRALVVTVGGTAEPVINVLQDLRPGFVCFVASQSTIDLVGGIKSVAGFHGTDWKVLVDNPESIRNVYLKTLEALEHVANEGYGVDDTILDYTGGTKVMSAGAVLAAADRGVRLSYVGGTQRSKGGVGVVELGSERRREDQHPWVLFHIWQKRKIGEHFRSHRYETAASHLNDLVSRARREEQPLLKWLARVVEGYALWDRFEHDEARKRLSRALRPEDLTALDTASVDTALDAKRMHAFAADVSANLVYLENLSEVTQRFKRPHVALAGDLLANATRRIAEGKHDDAVARMYRALEMLGQAEFLDRLGARTGEVPMEKIPAALQSDFVRYLNPNRRTLRVPLWATFEVLKEIGSDLGRRFADEQLAVRKLLDARNGSILAHGERPIDDKLAERMHRIILGFLPEAATQPAFPLWPLE